MTDWHLTAARLRQQWPIAARRIERRWPGHYSAADLDGLRYRTERWSSFAPLLDAVADHWAQPPTVDALFVAAATRHRNAKIRRAATDLIRHTRGATTP